MYVPALAIASGETIALSSSSETKLVPFRIFAIGTSFGDRYTYLLTHPTRVNAFGF